MNQEPRQQIFSWLRWLVLGGYPPNVAQDGFGSYTSPFRVPLWVRFARWLGKHWQFWILVAATLLAGMIAAGWIPRPW